MSKHIADIDLSIKLNVQGKDLITEANNALESIRKSAQKPIKLSMDTLELNNQLKTVQKTAMITAKTLQDIAMPKDLSSAKLQKETIGPQIEAATKNFNKAKKKEENLYEDSLSKAYTKYNENATKHNALNFAVTMDALYDQGIEYGAQRVIKGTQKTFNELSKIYWDALDNFDIDTEDEGYQNKVKEKSANFDELADTLAARTDLYRNEMNTLKSIQKDLDTEIGRYEAAENIALEEAKRRQAELEEVQNKNDQLAKKSSQNGSEAQVISKAELEKKIKEKQELVNRLNSKYPVEVDETVEAFKNVRNLRNNENRSKFITKFNKTDPELWKSFKTDEKIGRKTITSEMIQDFAKNNIKNTLFSTEKYKTAVSQLEAKIQESLQVEQKALAELQSAFQKQYGTDGLFGDPETSKGQIQTLYKQLQDLLSSDSVKINIETKPTIEELKEKIMALSKDSIPLTFDVENLASKIEEMQQNASFNDFGKTIESMGEAVQRFPEAFKNVDSIIKPSLESFSELRDMTTEIKSNFKQIGVSTIKDAEDVYKVTKKKKKTKSTASKNAEIAKEPSEKQLREEAWQKAIKSSKLEGVTSKELGNNKNGLYSFKQEVMTAQGGVKTLLYEFENLDDVITKKSGKFKASFLKSAQDITPIKAINDNYYKAVQMAKESSDAFDLNSSNVKNQGGINRLTVSWQDATGALQKYKLELKDLSVLYGESGALDLNRVKQFGTQSLAQKDLLHNLKLAASQTKIDGGSELNISNLQKEANGVYTLTASWEEASGAVKKYKMQTSDLSSVLNKDGTLDVKSIRSHGDEVLSNKQLLANLNKAASKTENNKYQNIKFSALSEENGIYKMSVAFQDADGHARQFQATLENINNLINKSGHIDVDTMFNSLTKFKANKEQLEKLQTFENSNILQKKYDEKNIISSALYSKATSEGKGDAVTALDKIKALQSKANELMQSIKNGDSFASAAEIDKKLKDLANTHNDLKKLSEAYGKDDSVLGIFSKDDIMNAQTAADTINEIYNVTAKLKSANKDGSFTFQFAKDGQIQEVKVAYEQIQEAANEIYKLQMQGVPSSDKVYESYGEKWLTGLRGKIGSLAQYLTGMNAVLTVYNKVKEGFSFAKEMNSSLTTINQTMSVTQDQMNALGQGSINVGRQLGVDAKNVMNAAEIYANANDTAKGVLDKAQASILLSNASGADTSTTSDQIQGVINQFDNLKGKETEVVNTYEKISANLGIDFAKTLAQKLEIV